MTQWSAGLFPAPLNTDPGAKLLEQAVNATASGLSNLGIINPKDRGAKWNGISDDTAVIASCLADAAASGGTVFLPPGEAVCNLDIPGGLAKRVRVVGAGKGVTILRSFLANRPIIRHSPTAALHSDGFYMGGLTLKPHPSNGVGSGAAIDCAGFRGTTFEDVEYIDNGSAFFESLFTLSAYRAGYTAPLCYYNTIVRPSAQQVSAGLQRLIKFENGGTGNALNNANGTTILNPYTYANNNLVCVIDALRSTATTIINGWFESNTGAVAVALGNSTNVLGGWFEANVLNEEITYATAVDGSANDALVQGAYIAGSGTITFQSGTSNNVWRNNWSQNKTFVDNGTNNVVARGATQNHLTLSLGGGTGIVSVGAADSAGTGYRTLRVPN